MSNEKKTYVAMDKDQFILLLLKFVIDQIYWLIFL